MRIYPTLPVFNRAHPTKTQLDPTFVVILDVLLDSINHCQARNKEALAFAFNTSLSSVNSARAYARQEGHNLSVGAPKTLLHNAAMVDRFIVMFAKHANLRLNNTDFKELLFYGVRAVA